MSSFPSAALQIRPPEQPDLLGNFAKLAQLRSILQQQQIQRQQIQQREEELQSRQGLIKTIKDSQGDPHKVTLEAMVNNGVLPDHADAYLKAQLSQQQAIGALDTNTRATLQAIDEKSADVAQSVRGIKDPAKRQAAYTQSLQTLQDYISSQQALNPQMKQSALQSIAQLPPQAPGDDDLDAFIALHNHGAAVTKQVSEQQKTAAAIAESTGKGKQAEAEAELKQQESKFYAGTGGALAPGVTPEAASFMSYMKTPGARPDQYPAYKAQSEAAATLPYKIATARAEGEARADIQAKIARGSNAALAQVPPHLVAPASAAANKAGEDYAQAQSVTERLQAMMDAARKGNVVSYQVIPEEGTLQITTSQGVHRINQAEIQQYAGGGSLWQRMQGHFGKALTGQSIPKSVLDDMAEIQKIQSQGSQLKYNNSLKTINQTYGAEFKPVEMDTMKSVQGGGPPSGATHIAPGSDGRNHYTNDKGEDLGIAP